jgi:hypothetical protein
MSGNATNQELARSCDKTFLAKSTLGVPATQRGHEITTAQGAADEKEDPVGRPALDAFG